jgi:HSP20 family protein
LEILITNTKKEVVKMAKDIFDIDKEFRKLRDQMDKVFGGFLGEPLDDDRKLIGSGLRGDLDNTFRTPVCDIYETDKEVIANIELPGVSKKDIKLNVSDNMLNVRAEKKYEKKDEDEKKGYRRYERSYSGFYRSFPLPLGVDENKVKANYKDGMLEVHMPKKEQKEVEAEEGKYIDID